MNTFSLLALVALLASCLAIAKPNAKSRRRRAAEVDAAQVDGPAEVHAAQVDGAGEDGAAEAGAGEYAEVDWHDLMEAKEEEALKTFNATNRVTMDRCSLAEFFSMNEAIWEMEYSKNDRALFNAVNNINIGECSVQEYFSKPSNHLPQYRTLAIAFADEFPKYEVHICSVLEWLQFSPLEIDEDVSFFHGLMLF